MASFHQFRRTFLSSQFFNQTISANGDNITCQPVTMELSESFVPVVPIGDASQLSVSSRGFQWSIYAVLPPGGSESGNTTTGFLYSGEKLNCIIVYAHHVYNFETRNLKFNSCASCLLITGFTIKICTLYDSATLKLPKFARLFYNSIPDLGLNGASKLDQIYHEMSIPPHSLPVSAFPPSYSETQISLYENDSISWHQVLQLSSWLGNISLIPAPADDSSQERSMFNNFTVFDTLFDAFIATDGVDGSSGFQIRVKKIGTVKPLGQVYNLNRIPEAWGRAFKYSLLMNGDLMYAANKDLSGANGKQIGVNYVCTKTTKEWQTIPKVVSVTVGSTLAVFSACFTILVAVARRLDSFQSSDEEAHQMTASPNQSANELDTEVCQVAT
ncbi:hypothetical protein PGT21_028823 [Puccinia graminis f. sp. tritici]|uniref:Uncharacterized protein n=2 Tax=Puccinia graminis f. sp. tritici TaxID=56615 RepID=A0A5B0M090_PUCGR|nr:hypothetical protein PGT21_028823 [Puccinia graminis f. sp. tritici]